MSHIVTIQTQVRDPAAIVTACHRLELPAPQLGSHRLFSGNVTGYAVLLSDWRYPLVCETERGQLHYDIYNGRWGEPSQLDRFLQSYTVEKVKLEGRQKGHTVTEQSLADGSVKLTINVGDAA